MAMFRGSWLPYHMLLSALALSVPPLVHEPSVYMISSGCVWHSFVVKFVSDVSSRFSLLVKILIKPFRSVGSLVVSIVIRSLGFSLGVVGVQDTFCMFLFGFPASIFGPGILLGL